MFLAIQVAMLIPLFIYGLIYILKIDGSEMLQTEDPDALAEFLFRFRNELILPALICTALTTILTIIYCRAIEKRSLYSMGFVRKKAVKDYLAGAGIGIIMFGVAVLIAFLSGTLSYNGFVLGNGINLLLAFLVGFIIQGMSEEVLLRGYLWFLWRVTPILPAVISNSLIFALLHIFNNGIAFTSFNKLSFVWNIRINIHIENG